MLHSVKQNKVLTVFTLIFLPITLSLGFWQLDRAEIKRQLLRQTAATNDLQTIYTLPQAQAAADFQLVELQAKWLTPYQWLVDNQVWQGQVGVDVVNLVLIEDAYLLVNRGWVAWPRRTSLPPTDFRALAVRLEGRLVPVSSAAFVLAEDTLKEGYPQLLQRLDIDLLTQQLDKPLLDQVLYLNEQSDGVYQPHWRPVNMGPEKHLGYAVQWFGLALTLCIMYLYRLYKSANEKEEISE